MKTFTGLLTIAAAIVGITTRAAAQSPSANPLIGGVWDRYSIVNTQGVDSGSPGWYHLTFTADGHFFVTAVPQNRKIPKAPKDLTHEELLNHLQGINIRFGTYTLIRNGEGPYMLTLSDDVSPFVPAVQGSCPPPAHCQIMFESGEVRLFDTKTGNHTKWRRIEARATQ